MNPKMFEYAVLSGPVLTSVLIGYAIHNDSKTDKTRFESTLSSPRSEAQNELKLYVQ